MTKYYKIINYLFPLFAFMYFHINTHAMFVRHGYLLHMKKPAIWRVFLKI